MNRVLKVTVVVAGWIALSAMVALAADKADKKTDDAAPKACCKALSRSTLAKLNKVSTSIEKAAGDTAKKTLDADLDRAAKAIDGITAELEAKIKSPKKSKKGDDGAPRGPQTPPCCQKICKRCLSSLGQVSRAIDAAKKAETLDSAKPQVTKADEALKELKAELEGIAKSETKAKGRDKDKEEDD
ncbi:MAG: hypothetical protein JXL80_13075 [Planctomycetes bacterium]|nr:hypothetical protein [Planctomycetota bacterium]